MRPSHRHHPVRASSDGALGIEAIKHAGGITFAQEEKSARYHFMPKSAIATGCVDFVLPPEGIARELVQLPATPTSPATTRRRR